MKPWFSVDRRLFCLMNLRLHLHARLLSSSLHDRPSLCDLTRVLQHQCRESLCEWSPQHGFNLPVCPPLPLNDWRSLKRAWWWSSQEIAHIPHICHFCIRSSVIIRHSLSQCYQSPSLVAFLRFVKLIIKIQLLHSSPTAALNQFCLLDFISSPFRLSTAGMAPLVLRCGWMSSLCEFNTFS